jgi:N utilization substance protein B
MSEPKAHPALQRSAARLFAVQALYQIERSGAAPEAVIQEFLEYRREQEVDGVPLVSPDFGQFRALVLGVCEEVHDLDNMLLAVLDVDWTLERLESLLLALLRAGIHEIASRQDIPARVVINEYVDLAHAFYGGKEPGLVNGVLDRLARNLREEEFSGRARE